MKRQHHNYKEYNAIIQDQNLKQNELLVNATKFGQPVDLNCGFNLKQKVFKDIRAETERQYQVFSKNWFCSRHPLETLFEVFRATGVAPRISIGQLRVMITKALSKAWKEMLRNPKIMIRAFEKPGLSLPLDGSLDSTKMHIQGCAVGIPPEMVIAPAVGEEPEEETQIAGWIKL